MCPRATLASQRPCSGMGRYRRRLSWRLTSLSLARIRFETVLRPRVDVCEAEEAERLRFLFTPGCPVAVGEPPELDQLGFIRVQLQPELREPLAQPGQEPLGVLAVLEPDDEVVRPAHDDHVAVRVAPSPPVGP